MYLFDGLFRLINSVSEAKRVNRLLSMSDHQLSMLGYDREGLVRSYIHGLGAR